MSPLEVCALRNDLKVPAVTRFVEALDVTPAGKLARSDA